MSTRCSPTVRRSLRWSKHPRILAILDALLRPSRLLAACQGTRIHPGETLQLLHADDELGAPRVRAHPSRSA